MSSRDSYQQPVKSMVRSRILKHAVESLTSSRLDAPTVTLAHFENMYEYCRRFIKKYKGVDIDGATRSAVEHWKEFQASKTGQKAARDLSVLYLAGPEPLNDLQVLKELGILPANVWAVEGDAESASRAVAQLATDSPIKLYQGSLQEFFEVVPQQFDIVYFDACGPLLGGKPPTLPVLKELFINQRLAPLSVLVTNFAEANQDGKSADVWKARMGAWFAARHEEPVPSGLEVYERVEFTEDYLGHIERNLSCYYSEFISRFVIGFAGQLLPWWRTMALPAARRQHFTEKAFDEAVTNSFNMGERGSLTASFDGIGHAALSPDTYPLLWSARLIDEHLVAGDPLRVLFSQDRLRSTTLSKAVNAVSLVRHFFEGYAGWASHNWAVASEDLLATLHSFRWFDSEGEKWHRVFCDTPFPHLLVDLLTGLYGYPYHVNEQRSLRLQYVSKKTPMYTDLFVLDQARYLYDLLPTLQFLRQGLSLSDQILMRICIDAIERHSKWACEELFRGSALASMGEEGFMFHHLPERENLGGLKPDATE